MPHRRLAHDDVTLAQRHARRAAVRADAPRTARTCRTRGSCPGSTSMAPLRDVGVDDGDVADQELLEVQPIHVVVLRDAARQVEVQGGADRVGDVGSDGTHEVGDPEPVDVVPDEPGGLARVAVEVAAQRAAALEQLAGRHLALELAVERRGQLGQSVLRDDVAEDHEPVLGECPLGRSPSRSTSRPTRRSCSLVARGLWPVADATSRYTIAVRRAVSLHRELRARPGRVRGPTDSRGASGSSSRLRRLAVSWSMSCHATEQPGLAVDDDLDGPPVGEPHDGSLQRHRLEEDEAERLLVGGHGEDVGGGHHRGDVGPPSEEAHAVADVELARRARRARRGRRRSSGSPTTSSTTSRPSSRSRAIARISSAGPFSGKSRHTVVTTSVVGRGSRARGAPRRRHPGVQAVDVDAVVDDVDAPGVHPAVDQRAGDELRHGDRARRRATATSAGAGPSIPGCSRRGRGRRCGRR